MTRTDTSDDSIGKSLREYARGIAGGLIFSLPLLYTMEVWWTGFTADPLRLAGYMVGTYLLLLGYNRFVGLRRDASWREVMIDSVEEMGIGFITATGVLWVLGRIGPGMVMAEVMGKIVVEAMTVAIGVSVGTAQLGTREKSELADSGMAEDGEKRKDDSITFTSQLIVAFCGAVLFAMNIAPTDEVQMIAVEISPWQTLLLAVASIIIGLSILYYIDFAGSHRYVHNGVGWKVPFGAIIMYAVALGVAALLLWFFGQFEGQGAITILSEIVVLGVVSTLGASAGRLLLQV